MTRPVVHRSRVCPPLTVLAHTALAVGQCLVIVPTMVGLVVATLSGACTSCLVLGARNAHRSAAFAPPLMATAIAVLSFEAVRHHLVGPASGPLAAALVMLPPGTALIIVTVELAARSLAHTGGVVLVTTQLVLFAAGTLMDAQLGELPALSDIAVHAGPGPMWLGAGVLVVTSIAGFRWAARVRRRDRT